MTPSRYRADLLREAKHDVSHALDIAIERLGIAGLCISAGYIRAVPISVAAYKIDAPDEPLDTAPEQSPHG